MIDLLVFLWALVMFWVKTPLKASIYVSPDVAPTSFAVMQEKWPPRKLDDASYCAANFAIYYYLIECFRSIFLNQNCFLIISPIMVRLRNIVGAKYLIAKAHWR